MGEAEDRYLNGLRGLAFGFTAFNDLLESIHRLGGEVLLSTLGTDLGWNIPDDVDRSYLLTWA